VTDKRSVLGVWAKACLLVVALAAWVGPAYGQGGVGQAVGLSGDVQVQLEKFGVGNVARKGDWAGIRLKLQDTSGGKPHELLIRLNGLDGDGDTPQYDHVQTSNPGVWQSVWMYARIPYAIDNTQGFTAAVYEAVENAGGPTPEFPTGYRPGRRLGALPIAPMGSSMVKPTEGLIGMMGARELGLQMYMGGQGNFSEPWHPQGHEKTDIVMGITPADLPDRWVGLRQFDALVWGQGDPAELRGERATAVREWVKRGGHLIIILPGVGQTWTNAASNDLIDIMPLVSVARKEVEDLSGYRDLVMRKPQLSDEQPRPFPKSGVVHTFKPLADAQSGEAMRILNNPDGECIVARRLVGAGAVTLIGLDLNQTAFSQFRIIDADVFWHRILGRRGNLEEDKSLRSPGRGMMNSLASRSPYLYDQDIPFQIADKKQAAGGVLIGFVVFVLYWLMAGPLGFGFLKLRKWTQHAWVSFVLAAGVFTVVSWTGATMLRPSAVGANHLTLLDHVYGQPVQRARAWVTLLIPWYGTAKIAITPPEQDSSGKRPVNALSSWDSPVVDGSSWGGFPDVRGYAVDTRAPDSMRAPTRSTVKQLEADWAGGPAWEMPRPLRVEEGGTGKLVINDAPPGVNPLPLIEGTLVHKMPGALRDVLVVVVRRLPSINGNPVDAPSAEAFVRTEAWEPGDPMDLGFVTRRSGGERGTQFSLYLNNKYKPATSRNTFSPGAPDEADKGRYMERLMSLAFFSQLPPPIAGEGVQYAAQRAATHGWDLSLWFTHPCVIVVGHIDKGPSPVPLTVDGKPVPTEGMTFVRWVYPLPDNPPEYTRKAEQEKPAEKPPATPEPTPEPGEGV
jgi:hypothetical protein